MWPGCGRPGLQAGTTTTVETKAQCVPVGCAHMHTGACVHRVEFCKLHQKHMHRHGFGLQPLNLAFALISPQISTLTKCLIIQDDLRAHKHTQRHTLQHHVRPKSCGTRTANVPAHDAPNVTHTHTYTDALLVGVFVNEPGALLCNAAWHGSAEAKWWGGTALVCVYVSMLTRRGGLVCELL